MSVLSEFFNNKDTNWVNRAFLLPSNAIAARDKFMEHYSDATIKFTDGSLGGNYAINQPPQYTRTADIKEKRIVDIGNDTGLPRTGGMGRYYSEAIDDHQELIYFRMGVPGFNSLTSWYRGFYDVSLGKLVATGRSASIAGILGHMGGLLFGAPIIALNALTTTANFLFNRQPSQYIYLKPTMHPYWEAVTGIVNEMAVNLNIGPAVLHGGVDTKSAKYQNDGNKRSIIDKYGPDDTDTSWKFYNETLMPKELVMTNNGFAGIDIRAIATKAHRLTYSWNEKVKEIMNDALSKHGGDLNSALDAIMEAGRTIPENKNANGIRKEAKYTYNSSYSKLTGEPPAPASINDPDKNGEYSLSTVESPEATKPEEKSIPSVIFESLEALFPSVTEQATEMAEMFRAHEQDGGQFVCFRVDNLGSANFSVSNSTKESSVAQMINGTSSSVREKFFNFANGNLGDVAGGFIGTAGALAETALTAAADFTLGMANAVGAGGLGMFGNAFVDIPQMYDSSSTSMPSANLKISLRSPYGNDLSRLKNLLIPAAMLMAMSFPRSTGVASYNGPFLLEAYSRGRFQVRLGMVRSFSMTLGVGNVPFNKDKKPLGIDIDLNIEEMGGIVHVPIAQSLSPLDILSPGRVMATLFSEDTRYKDMLAVMCSMPLHSQIYQMPKLMRNFEKTKLDWSLWFTWSNMMSAFRDTGVGQVVSNLYTTKAMIF